MPSFDDPIGSVRWDKADPFQLDGHEIKKDNIHNLVDLFSKDVEFQNTFNMDENVKQYASFKHRNKYKRERVIQNLMRILNVYRKKRNIQINNLDELKYAAIELEDIIYAGI